MHPVRSGITRAALTTAIAVGLLAAAAAPASAFTADGTATLLVDSSDPAIETAATDISGECPTGTDAVLVRLSWTDADGAHSLNLAPALNAADGTFADGYFLSAYSIPNAYGVTGHYALSCTGGGIELATAAADYTFPDFGQTLSVPATVDPDAALVATVDCGSTPADTLYVTHYLGNTELSSEFVAYTGPGAYAFATPSSLGYADGDTGEVRIACQVSTPSVSVPSARYVDYAVATVVVDPPAAPPASGPAAELAETGADELLPLGVLDALLLAAGVAAMARGRRAIRRSAARR